MNQKLMPSTRQKINELTLCHFKLWNKTGDRFLTLMDIFSNKESAVVLNPNQIGFKNNTNKEQDTVLNPNQIGFKNNTKRQCLEFLAEKNLITKGHKITALGLTVILSHKLGITILSVFILSKLYHCQMTIRKDMAFPYPTLVCWLELFSSANTICRNVYDMKQKQILDNNLRYRLARINIDKLDEFKKYDRYFQQINQYVDGASEKIDDLISADTSVIKQRTQNLKLFAGMSFA